jgi:hypothetical protein
VLDTPLVYPARQSDPDGTSVRTTEVGRGSPTSCERADVMDKFTRQPDTVHLRRQSAADVVDGSSPFALPIILTGTPKECRAIAERHEYAWLIYSGLPFGGFWFMNSGGPGRVLIKTPASPGCPDRQAVLNPACISSGSGPLSNTPSALTSPTAKRYDRGVARQLFRDGCRSRSAPPVGLCRFPPRSAPAGRYRPQSGAGPNRGRK